MCLRQLHACLAGCVVFLCFGSLLGQSTESPTRFIRGENNCDGKVNLTDSVNTLLCLFCGVTCSACEDAMDVNDSGDLALDDPLQLLTYLFSNGPCPLPPFPDLGWDATPDTLDCLDYR